MVQKINNGKMPQTLVRRAVLIIHVFRFSDDPPSIDCNCIECIYISSTSKGIKFISNDIILYIIFPILRVIVALIVTNPNFCRSVI